MIVQSIVETESEWAGYADASRDIYLALQQEHEIGARQSGSLYLASTDTERAVLEEFAQTHAPSYHCSYLAASKARARYPFIQPRYCAGALLFPDDLTLEPRRLLRLLIPYLVEKGLVDYLPQTTIGGVEPAGRGCRVTTPEAASSRQSGFWCAAAPNIARSFPSSSRRAG
jgi:glycine/D-amino acid oxidase-like deaminating enzyme